MRDSRLLARVLAGMFLARYGRTTPREPQPEAERKARLSAAESRRARRAEKMRRLAESGAIAAAPPHEAP